MADLGCLSKSLTYSKHVVKVCVSLYLIGNNYQIPPLFKNKLLHLNSMFYIKDCMFSLYQLPPLFKNKLLYLNPVFYIEDCMFSLYQLPPLFKNKLLYLNHVFYIEDCMFSLLMVHVFNSTSSLLGRTGCSFIVYRR